MNELFKQLSEVREHTAEDTLAVATALLGATQKLVALNLDTARAVLEGGTLGLSALLQTTNPAQAISMQTGVVCPSPERTAAYYRDCYDILLETWREMTRPLEKQVMQASSMLYHQFGMGSLGNVWALGGISSAPAEPQAKAAPKPAPKPAAKPAPKAAVAKPAVKAAPKAAAKPAAKVAPKPVAKVAPKAAAKPAAAKPAVSAKPAATAKPAAPKPAAAKPATPKAAPKKK